MAGIKSSSTRTGRPPTSASPFQLGACHFLIEYFTHHIYSLPHPLGRPRLSIPPVKRLTLPSPHLGGAHSRTGAETAGPQIQTQTQTQTRTRTLRFGMPSKSNDQGIFPFSRSRSFFTQSRSKSQQVVNITPPIQSIQRSNTTQATGTTEIEDKSHSHSESPVSDSPPPIVIPTRSSSKASKRSSSRHRYSQSISNTVHLSSIRRSVSLRSVSSPQGRHYRQASTTSLVASTSNDNLAHHCSKLSIPKFGRRNKSNDDFNEADFVSDIESEKRDMLNSTMTTVQYRNPPPGRPPTSHSTSHSTMGSMNYSSTSSGTTVPQQPVPNLGPGTQNPNIVYQHILDTASKRISTLDYLRKAYV